MESYHYVTAVPGISGTIMHEEICPFTGHFTPSRTRRGSEKIKLILELIRINLVRGLLVQCRCKW